MNNQDIHQSINDIISAGYEHSLLFLPRIFWALALVGTGWLAAMILKKITLKIVRGVDQLFEKAAEQKGMQHVRIKQSLERFICETVCWITFTFFLVLAVHILQFELLSSFLENILKSLPLLALGILIIVASFFIGSTLRHLVLSAFDAMEIEQAELLGNGIQVTTVFLGILIGVAQVGIDISFLTTVVSVVVGTVLGALALAFGLGARTYVANILSSAQVRRIYQIGDTIMIENMKGKIVEINSTMIILQSDEGQVAMPAKIFLEKMSLLYDQVDKNEA